MDSMTSCREAPVQAADALSRRSISSSFSTASFLLGNVTCTSVYLDMRHSALSIPRCWHWDIYCDVPLIFSMDVTLTNLWLRIHRANLGSLLSVASANSLRWQTALWNGQYACIQNASVNKGFRKGCLFPP